MWREVVELGSALKKIAEVVGSRVSGADVAIIHDTDARWASELDAHPSIDTSLMAETRLWHDAFYRLGLTTDVFRPPPPTAPAPPRVVAAQGPP